MNEEDELAGSGVELEEEDIEEEEEEDDDDDSADDDEVVVEDVDELNEEDEDDCEDHDDVPVGNSNCVIEYNRQWYAVPNASKVRDHERPHVVETPEILGEMSTSMGGGGKWPPGKDIDPASVVVVQGKLRDDDPTLHNVWYLRITVKGRDDGDDINILRHIPRKIVGEILSIMAKDRGLCESSLVLSYQPTNNNEKVLVPSSKVNGWDQLSHPPRTIMVKPPGVGVKRGTSTLEKENGESKKKSSGPSAETVALKEEARAAKEEAKVAKEAAKVAKAEAKAAAKEEAAAKAAAREEAKAAKEMAKATAPVKKAAAKEGSNAVPSQLGNNPWNVAKQSKANKSTEPVPEPAPEPAPVSLTRRESYTIGEADETEPQGSHAVVKKRTTNTVVQAPGSAPVPPKDRTVTTSIEMLQQFRGGSNETPRNCETMNRVFSWACKSRTVGAATMQKLVIPEWAASWKLTLEVSSDPSV